jgi:hypothetical protein
MLRRPRLQLRSLESQLCRVPCLFPSGRFRVHRQARNRRSDRFNGCSAENSAPLRKASFAPSRCALPRASCRFTVSTASRAEAEAGGESIDRAGSADEHRVALDGGAHAARRRHSICTAVW